MTTLTVEWGEAPNSPRFAGGSNWRTTGAVGNGGGNGGV